MSAGRRSRDSVSWITGTAFLLAMLVLGFIAGVVVATRILYTTDVGWDQIGDALGGAVVGGLVALVAGTLGLGRTPPWLRVLLATVALAVSAGGVVYLRSTPPHVRSLAGTARVAPFGFALTATASPDAPTGLGLPWQRLEISSELSFDYTTPGATPEQCAAVRALDSDRGVADLAAFRSLLAGLPDHLDCGPPCPACTNVRLEWDLGDRQSTLAINDRCWFGDDRLQPLRAAIDRILKTYGDHVTCAPVQ